MIKKILCAFLMIISCGIVHANIHIDGSVVRTVILEQIDSEHQLAATQEYEVQLKVTGDSTMSASGLYKVCTAAGWDISTPEGKSKCDKFVNALLDSGTYTYYEVCGPDKGKSGGTERCIDNVFYALVNGIDVQIGQAIELSKEYAVVKFNDDIECSSGTRKGTINPKNDYVKCTSKLTPTYYEFKFDDVNQNTNTPIYKDTIRAVGNIHGVSFKDSGCSLERIMNDTACTVGYETTDAVVCDKLSKSLGRFGMKAEVRNVTGASLNDVERFCAVSFAINKCTAAKEYGIDETVFKEVQYPLSPTLENYVKDYVTTQLNTKNISLSSFSCDKMPRRKDKTVAGLHVSDGYLLRCHLDDKCIDFEFEDLSESANYSKNAALSRLACIKHGGISNGENCRGLDEKQCAALGEKTKNSGKFMGTHYDRVRGGCILNGAVTESHINLVGEITAGIALTLITDGAATIPVVVSVGTDLAFDAINDWQRKIPYKDYQEFIQHVLACSEDSEGVLKDVIRISKINSVENKYCLSETIGKDYQLVVGQMDKLAPEDQRILANVFVNIVENIGDVEYIRRVSESEISLLKQARNYTSSALLAGLFLFNPEKMLSKFDDVTRDVARLRYGASKNFTQHLDDFKHGRTLPKFPMERLSKSEWQALNKSLASEGVELFEKDGRMVFRKLAGNKNALFLEKLKQYTGYDFIYKSAAESGLGRGHYRLDLSYMSDSEIYTVQNKLHYTGVADKAKIIKTTDKRTLLVLYEDDMINLGSNMKVSGSMLDNFYGSGGKVDNLQAKVENILSTSYPNENALRQAWHDSGAWNMNEAHRLTQDLRAGVIRDIKSNPDLANRIKRYNSLSLAEKDQVWIDINYIVGGQNRVHTGRTMIGFVDNSDFVVSGQKRFLGAHNGNDYGGHMFRYNRQELNDFDRMFSTVVHENVHGFQESGRTAINQNAWQYRTYNYSRGSTSGYTNQLVEMESRFVQEYASRGFLSELLNSL